MDEYVPAMMPMSSASEKPRSAEPPSNSSATTTMDVTTLVMMVRDSVWLMAWSSVTSDASRRFFSKFSRMRSNTMTVSFSE